MAFDFRAGHNRVEPAPGVDLPVIESGPPIGVLQVLDGYLFCRDAFLLERLEQQEVRVGSFGDRHRLTL